MTEFKMPTFEKILEFVQALLPNVEVRIYDSRIDRPIEYEILINRKDYDWCFSIRKAEIVYIFQINYKMGTDEFEIIDIYNFFENDIHDFIKKYNLDYTFSKIDDGTLYQIELKD